MSINREEILDILTKKGATNPCHRCNKNQFTILDGYTQIGLQDSLREAVLSRERSIPVVDIICSNCGAITSHALGALGLLTMNNGEL